MNSFVDYALVTEMTRNVDAYRLSTFLFKDKDSNGGLLHIGPPWDYNLAWGNANYCDGSLTTGWVWDFNSVCDGDFWLIPFWWDRFMQDPAFVQRLNERWTELRAGPYATARIHAYIDSVAQALENPVTRNYDRWGNLGEYVWPNEFVGQTYQEEINYLKNWITQRLNWLDANFPALLTITSVDPDELNRIRLYPNPVGDIMKISDSENVAQVDLRDLSGRLLKRIIHEQGNPVFTMNMSGISPGVYLITIMNRDGTLQTARIVK
jgi:hypothetical protein